MVPGVINPAVNPQWQEGVEVEPDGEIILCFAVAHPVHHIWLVQLCFQLVPKTPRHWRQHRGRAEPVTNPIPLTLWGCPTWRLPHSPASPPLGLPGDGWAPAGAAPLENNLLCTGERVLGTEVLGEHKNILGNP